MLGERDIVIFQQNERIVELQTANEQAAKHLSEALTQIEELKKQGEPNG